MSAADQTFNDKVALIRSSLKKTKENVSKAEKLLYIILEKELLNKLEIVNGVVVDSDHNRILLAKMDRVFNSFEKDITKGIIKHYLTSMTEVAILNRKYYEKLGFATDAIEDIVEAKTYIKNVLDIDDKGDLKQDGYLYRLIKNQQSRDNIKNYVVKSLLHGETSLEDFRNGFKDLIQGTEKKKFRNGTLQSYYKQYTYDTYNQVDEALNNKYAKGLGLDWFLYGGTIIDTTRSFCAGKAGKYFHRKDAENWESESPKPIITASEMPYVGIIHRGGINCRHYIKWVPEEFVNN